MASGFIIIMIMHDLGTLLHQFPSQAALHPYPHQSFLANHSIKSQLPNHPECSLSPSSLDRFTSTVLGDVERFV